MNRIRIVSLAAAFFLAATGVVCAKGGDEKSSSEKTEISILIGKPEIVDQLYKTIDAFNASHPDIKASIVPLAGQNAMQKITVLYASKNVPTIINMSQEFAAFKDKLLDLSAEPWVKHAFAGTLDMVTENGTIKGMPMTVEAFGFLYNKEVLDKAVGGTFDPGSIRTRDDLKRLLDAVAKIAPGGAVHISPLDWSLGAHFTNILFTTQSQDPAKRQAFLADMEAGKVDLGKNAIFNGWMDTFDLIRSYNSAKASPLSPAYDDGVVALSTGNVGLWFMGNWAYPNLHEANPEGSFGFLPVPISNAASDYGNAQISVGVPAFWTIDATQSTQAQQAAAKEFLSWLASSDEGQNYCVNNLNFVPVFDDVKVMPKDTLSQSIMKYMNDGNALEWMNNRYPADAWPAMGAIMQKYLANIIDRRALASSFEDYWKSVGTTTTP